MKEGHKIVVDCSYVIPFFFEDEDSLQVEELMAKVFDGLLTLIINPIFYYEIFNVLSVGLKRNRIDQEGLRRAIKLLRNLPVLNSAFSIDEFQQITSLASQFDLSVYDASYLYSASNNSATLATLDKKLKDAAVQFGIETL